MKSQLPELLDEGADPLTPQMAALQRAVEHFGSRTALARALGVTLMAITQWFKRGRVPPERCIAIETACDGKVTRHELRPDVFGPPPAVLGFAA